MNAKLTLSLCLIGLLALASFGTAQAPLSLRPSGQQEETPLVKLSRETTEFAKGYCCAKDKDVFRAELTSKVDKLFDLHIEARRKSLDDAEARLKKARADLEERVGRKRGIVDAKVHHLITESAGFNW